MPRMLEPTADPAWALQQHGYDLLREHDIEARFAVSNGFLAVRGAREASRGPVWVSWMHTLARSRPRDPSASLGRFALFREPIYVSGRDRPSCVAENISH